MKPYRIIIEGMADDLFLPGLYEDAAKLTPANGSVTFEIGPVARVPLVREEP